MLKAVRLWADFLLFYLIFLWAVGTPIGFMGDALNVDHSIWYAGTILAAGYCSMFFCRLFVGREELQERDGRSGIARITKMQITTWLCATGVLVKIPWTNIGMVVFPLCALGLAYHMHKASKESRMA